MSSLNKVMIIGNLGDDPESRTFDNGGKVTNISVATSEQWTDKNTGERKEQTEWHRIVLYNRLAEVASQFLRKGSKVYIEGALHTRKWKDQEGNDRFSTEIRASNMKMLDGLSSVQQNTANNSSNQASQQPANTGTLTSALANTQSPSTGEFEEFDDADIPFG